MVKMEEGKIYCAACDEVMKSVVLPQYEFEERVTLHNVRSYKCPRCKQLFFTEVQAKDMEARTNELKEYTFGFKRKVTISGRSLVLGIPVELAEHINLEQGTEVKIVPVSNDGFMVRKVEH